MNFLIYGAFHSILAWVTLVCVLIQHSMGLVSEIKENMQNVGVAVYYLLIAIWFIGILYFFISNAYG